MLQPEPCETVLFKINIDIALGHTSINMSLGENESLVECESLAEVQMFFVNNWNSVLACIHSTRGAIEVYLLLFGTLSLHHNKNPRSLLFVRIKFLLPTHSQLLSTMCRCSGAILPQFLFMSNDDGA